MEINIRKADKKDMPAVLELIRELAVFEREPDAVEVTVEELQKDGFDGHPAFECFVAEVNNHISGMAFFYKRYSTWTGKALHLEDLIVSNDSRGKGIGTRLLDAVVQYAYDMGAKRISWVVLDWNKDAIEFYKSKGAKILNGWDVVRLDENGIKNYITKLN